MGMYTELVLKTEVNTNLPMDVEAVLQHLFNGADAPETLPEHPFFNCGRWPFIGRSSSYYHVPWSTSRYEENYIFSRSDLKNYDGEIAKFISWLTPYISELNGTCIGWSWYEEEDKPTLIILGEPA